MVAAVTDWEALLFHTCLRCSAAAILLASWDFAPLRTAARGHFGLFIAASSQEMRQLMKAFSDTLRVVSRSAPLTASTSSTMGSRRSSKKTAKDCLIVLVLSRLVAVF